MQKLPINSERVKTVKGGPTDQPIDGPTDQRTDGQAKRDVESRIKSRELITINN